MESLVPYLGYQFTGGANLSVAASFPYSS